MRGVYTTVSVPIGVTCGEAIKQIAQWADKKAGGRQLLIDEIRGRCPTAKGGLNRKETVTDWMKGSRYDADVLVAMISFLTGQPIEDFVASVGKASVFELDKPDRLDVIEAATERKSPAAKPRRKGGGSLQSL